MKFERELLKGVAPTVVLEILSRGQMYGYQLSEAVSQRSGEVLSLGRGTLYPLLYNLEAKGLVSAEWQESEMLLDGKYTLRRPEKGYVAIFGEAVYKSGGNEFFLSTNVRILEAQ